MNRLRFRLRQDLRVIAEQASVTDSAWEEITRRIDSVDAEVDLAVPGDEPEAVPTFGQPGRQIRTVVAAAAAAVVVGVALISTNRANDRMTTAETSGDDVRGVVASSEAQRIVDDYVEAFNAGDAETATGLFSPDATVRYEEADIRGSRSQWSVAQWKGRIGWLSGQDARISEAACATGDIEIEADLVSIRCEWRLDDAITIAAGVDGDRIATEFVVEDGQVSAMSQVQDYVSGIRLPFWIWGLENYPDDEHAFRWSLALPPHEAAEFGRRTVTYAEEWVKENEHRLSEFETPNRPDDDS